MAQRLLAKTEFARLRGVSKAAISKALRGPLRAALVDDRIDAEHPAAKAYLRAGKTAAPGRAPTRSKKRPPAAPAAPPPPRPPRSREPEPGRRRRPPDGLHAPRLSNALGGLEQLAELPGYADLTMRELAARWGTFRVFADLLDALKTMEDIRKTHLHNEETEGALISRDLVKKHVFGSIEETNKRLLSDTPRTIAGRLLGMAKSNATLEEAERAVRDLIGSQLKLAKQQALKVLGEPQTDG